MAERTIALAELWREADFHPNDAQKDAIRHVEGPLYLPAGPGSGKTRVLLWRTLNLLVFHDVEPREVFLSTFTEKAALQLKEGLQALLGTVTNRTGQPFDLSQMYVGTVHSLCQRLLTDRRFSWERHRPRPPRLLDELGQYFYLYRTRTWRDLLQSIGLDIDAEGSKAVDAVFGGKYDSKHWAVEHSIAFFNRLSEECIEPEEALDELRRNSNGLQAYLDEYKLDREGLEMLVRLYAAYRKHLANARGGRATDFSLIQQEAYKAIRDLEGAGHVFKHVIVDEYQDTNTIQERLFFKLAAGHRNICIVGDDDQALYRFRGATVENFVQFPERCRQHLGRELRTIALTTNYRSRKRIVDYYRRFIDLSDWERPGGGSYRVAGKDIIAARQDPGTAVVRTQAGKPNACFDQIADLVHDLIRRGVVQDANQVAFLYPSLKSVQVGRMKQALEERGLTVHAPRAGHFLQTAEATEMFGVLASIFGTSALVRYAYGVDGSYNTYRTWLHDAKTHVAELASLHPRLAAYIEERRREIADLVADYAALISEMARQGWDRQAPYDIATMEGPLAHAEGISERAERRIVNRRLRHMVEERAGGDHPVDLDYVLWRATSLDWTVLDAFYHICGMAHFKAMFDVAQEGKDERRDEGPICNLALISQYLRRFMDEYSPVIKADLLADGMLSQLLFGSYLYALWRLGESEYENPEHPFPQGRIPFLTIHQAKGLEFPVVVLANPSKRNKGPQLVEKMVRPFLARDQGEPLDRMAEFDIMRMFYVALSRAKNLLVIADLQGPGISINPPFRTLMDDLPTIDELDLGTIPPAALEQGEIPRPYSYTADYLAYRRCPRQYMIFRKYGFEASHTQTEFFGSLVHRTLDDLHNYLIAQKAGAR